MFVCQQAVVAAILLCPSCWQEYGWPVHCNSMPHVSVSASCIFCQIDPGHCKAYSRDNVIQPIQESQCCLACSPSYCMCWPIFAAMLNIPPLIPLRSCLIPWGCLLMSLVLMTSLLWVGVQCWNWVIKHHTLLKCFIFHVTILYSSFCL